MTPIFWDNRETIGGEALGSPLGSPLVHNRETIGGAVLGSPLVSCPDGTSPVVPGLGLGLGLGFRTRGRLRLPSTLGWPGAPRVARRSFLARLHPGL